MMRIAIYIVLFCCTETNCVVEWPVVKKGGPGKAKNASQHRDVFDATLVRVCGEFILHVSFIALSVSTQTDCILTNFPCFHFSRSHGSDTR